MKKDSTPQDFLRRFSAGGLPELAKSLLPSPSPPAQGESCVVALRCPMTAALCFDRVWSIPLDGTACPPEVRFSAASDAELVVALFLHLLHRDPEIFNKVDPREFADLFMTGDIDSYRSRPDFLHAYNLVTVATALGVDLLNYQGAGATITRTLSAELQHTFGSPVLPLYGSESARDAEYQPGDSRIIVAALRELDVINEAALSWEQVLEFRRDKASRASYRRLVHWLDGEMAHKPTGFVVDEIGVRLDSYYAAIRKHGLKTRVGVLATLIDAKVLASAAAAAGGSAVAGHPFLGMVAGGTVVFGKALLAFAQGSLELHDIVRDHAEIAFVVEVSKEL